jgi:trimeric autotransporter adhesin
MRTTQIFTLFLSALVLIHPIRGQVCWTLSPAHSGNGVDYIPTSSVIWDPGGGQPLRLVLTPPTTNFAQVKYWDGSRMVTMPGVFNGSVFAAAVYNGSLYVGGRFSQVDALTVNGIARWNGTAWTNVGNHILPSTTGAEIYSMIVFNNELWVGGFFFRSGASGLQNWARWNGSSWTGGGSDTDGDIFSMAIHNGVLYAGTGGGTDSGIHRWGSQGFERIATVPFANWVYALGSYGGMLIAGGTFPSITPYGGSPVQASRIARWDGNTWHTLAGGVSPSVPVDTIRRFAIYNNQLVAAGSFSYMNGQPISNIAVWDGFNWGPVGGPGANPAPFSDRLSSVIVYGGQLVVTGRFQHAGELFASHIARFDGSNWSPLIGGINNRVRTMAPSGSILYAGGDFVFPWPGAGTINRLMRTNGSNVDPIADLLGVRGTDGNVLAVRVHTFNIAQGPRLIIGGVFSTAGNVSASNIAYFDLSTTSGYAALGQGFNGGVSALASVGTTLYAAGSFTASGSTQLSRLARFSAGNWVSPGPWTFPNLSALGTHEGRLVIGGLNGGLNGVSALEGTTLHSYGSANGRIRAFAIYEGDLIAAGDFTTIGSASANSIARRDSATGQWMPMGPGLGGAGLGGVHALTVHNGHLYAGGTFVQSGTAPIYRVARWNGTSWVRLTTAGPAGAPGGLDGPVYTLASHNGMLNIGGEFNASTDGHAAPNWIRYTCTPCYANCDGSTTAPILNVEDFTCFINRFAEGSTLPTSQQITHYANCDGSFTFPVLNVEDFTCFINKFAFGCP